MLEVQDMRLSFSRYRTLLRREWLPVLNGVSVSVQRGELVSLIGASGAGKSLLAHAVLGILPSTTKLSGSMQFEGQPLTPARQNALRGKRIALVPQAITYLDPTARANAQVSWAATAAKLGTGAVASKLAHDELLRYGLPEVAHSRFPHQLSGGMAQRVALARALVNDPSLLVLDEPLGKLDSLTRLAMQTELVELWQRTGFSALLVTHDVEEALFMAQRVVVLSERPATIKQVLVNDLPYPRHRGHPRLAELRHQALALLGLDASW